MSSQPDSASPVFSRTISHQQSCSSSDYLASQSASTTFELAHQPAVTTNHVDQELRDTTSRSELRILRERLRQERSEHEQKERILQVEREAKNQLKQKLLGGDMRRLSADQPSAPLPAQASSRNTEDSEPRKRKCSEDPEDDEEEAESDEHHSRTELDTADAKRERKRHQVAQSSSNYRKRRKAEHQLVRELVVVLEDEVAQLKQANRSLVEEVARLQDLLQTALAPQSPAIVTSRTSRTQELSLNIPTEPLAQGAASNDPFASRPPVVLPSPLSAFTSLSDSPSVLGGSFSMLVDQLVRSEMENAASSGSFLATLQPDPAHGQVLDYMASSFLFEPTLYCPNIQSIPRSTWQNLEPDHMPPLGRFVSNPAAGQTAPSQPSDKNQATPLFHHSFVS